MVNTADANAVLDVLSRPTGAGNSTLPADVNGSGGVTALDALLIINFLGRSNQTLPSQIAAYTYATIGNIAGLLETSTDRNGLVTKYEYYFTGNKRGLIQKVTVGFGIANARITNYEYDEQRNQTAVVDPLLRRNESHYDNLGRVFETLYKVNGQILQYSSIVTYDKVNAISSLTEPGGRLTEYVQRDPMSRPKKVKLPSINGARPELNYVYDQYGFIDSMTGQLGRKTEYDFVKGRLDQTASPGTDASAVLTTKYAYTPSGAVKSVAYTAGGSPIAGVSYQYDAEGRIVVENRQQTASTSIVTKQKYDNLGRQIQSETGAGTTQFVYDDLDRLVSTILPMPVNTSSDSIRPSYATYYDAAGNPTGSRDARGNFTVDTLNAFGEVLVSTSPDPDGAGPRKPLKTVYDRDPYGRVNFVVAPNVAEGAGITTVPGVKTTYLYDEYDRVKSVTALDPVLSQAYTQSSVYDAYGRPLSQTSADGTVTTINYGQPGVSSPTSVTVAGRDASQRVTTYHYDIAGRNDTINAPGGQLTVIGYDNADNVKTTEVAFADAAASATVGILTTNTYDQLGQLVLTRDNENHQTIFIRNRDGSVAERQIGNNRLAYTYDNVGRTQTITDGVGNTTSYQYDPLNRVATETNQLGDSRSYKYDADGNVTRSVNRDGLATSFKFDALGLKTEEKWLKPGDEESVPVNWFNYTYDAAGRLTEVRDYKTTVAFVLDGFGRSKEEKTDLVGFNKQSNLKSNFNAFGERVNRSLTVNSGVQFSDTIGYDAFGRLNEISRDNSGLPGAASRGGVKANFHYDAVGRLDKVESNVKRTSGTLSDVVKTDYVFDTSGRLGTIKHAFLLSGGGTNPTSLDYTNTYFNKTTLLKSTHSAVDGLQQFTYDAAKQLDTVLSSVIVQPSDYNFDANGNRTGVVNGATTKTYQQGTDNRLLSDGVLEYKYNKEGARVNRGTLPPPPPNTGSQGSGSGSYSSGSSSGSAGSQYDTYLWDHRGRLTEIQSSKYGTQAKQVKYTYDAFDRRVAKEFASGSSSGSYSSNGSYGSGGTDATDGAERYIYDGDHLLAVLDRDGDVIEQDLHGPMVDQVMAE